ncbi:PREDICTED: tRNA-splicing endonuclease subunit Sen2-1 [Nelumbo nucifera]|uniref:tRNA-intron lyase n=1 Tax=Nelumbo nucifera TaxID=4432 RepID=A0A1U8Q2J6_NELNU|nr:PREDICTED: tRNA-splicing endonuclease subunit Sen2-1 [Nelumbo nucifera]XP_010253527.1 PREDICTED: tRNA-splicing endonuclease subunit Sen2-1 [Nelumbo nucifera]XP_010253528.1 PREDICTED: tRNA-splicing endonuclease subunit Sen2-1 [Nelumbo nucifera]XP_010253529.1 PREDICTED: tRNA-splicing endonuclease subunit Sen2-1 [Nelumbo nucifera]XP_010253530.1 PREDICTED: tRNA-splicing endonuclease subunit Sen2-1 [Nelumbo nucifera]XP_019052837.1 PREDICTED: tRNA-splicing endonuclease subunit Sen2-1 [Nelumbo nuc
MGPRWKGKDSEARALAEPMSEIVQQLQSCLIHSKTRGLLLGCSVLLGAGADCMDLLIRACFGQPIITAEKDKQWFELSLEESFYLFHSLRCLEIAGEDKRLKNEDEIWQYIISKKPAFPYFYKAYSHLRDKNWVVRSGFQYGVDFVAYHYHPALVHSEYAILVLSEGSDDVNGRLNVWSDLKCMVRLCGSVVKTLLVLRINRSDGYLAVSPLCLEKCNVEEYTITRWNPEQCREEKTINKRTGVCRMVSRACNNNAKMRVGDVKYQEEIAQDNGQRHNADPEEEKEKLEKLKF